MGALTLELKRFLFLHLYFWISDAKVFSIDYRIKKNIKILPSPVVDHLWATLIAGSEVY